VRAVSDSESGSGLTTNGLRTPMCFYVIYVPYVVKKLHQ
jgi:hypothetical protein